MGDEPGAEDYPQTQLDFEDRFRTEADCRAYLVALRWPQGFVCPDCKGHVAWRTTRDRVECATCRGRSQLARSSIKTHKPLRLWFRAMWWLTSQKYGANAMGLQRVLGLGSYRMAWTWLHKLRRAMVRPEPDRLSGTVEVDETFVGGVEAGEGRRHVGKKALVRTRQKFAAGRLVAFECGASVTLRPTVFARSFRRPSCRAMWW
jgi:hypothetical protein